MAYHLLNENDVTCVWDVRKVILCWAWLALGWLTVCRQTMSATQVNTAWPSLHEYAQWVPAKAGM